MRLSHPAYALALTALISPTFVTASSLAAPTPPQEGKKPSSSTASDVKLDKNTIIAKVNDEPIRLGDVQDMVATLPEQLRTQLPANVIYSVLSEQLIKQKALLLAAQKSGIGQDPAVKKKVEAAANAALQDAFLEQKIKPLLTDKAITDYYNKNYLNKPAEQELHARHILVDSKAQAEDIIKKLKKGADFQKLAKEISKDKKSAAENGGDLGWFKKDDMLPEFSKAAFAMKPGTISSEPVKTQYGWHVIEVLATRKAVPPKLDDVRATIRQKLAGQFVNEQVKAAMSAVKIERFAPDGKPLPAVTTKPDKK